MFCGLSTTHCRNWPRKQARRTSGPARQANEAREFSISWHGELVREAHASQLESWVYKALGVPLSQRGGTKIPPRIHVHAVPLVIGLCRTGPLATQAGLAGDTRQQIARVQEIGPIAGPLPWGRELGGIRCSSPSQIPQIPKSSDLCGSSDCCILGLVGGGGGGAGRGEGKSSCGCSRSTG